MKSGPDVSEQNAASIINVDGSFEKSVRIYPTEMSHILILPPQVYNSVYNWQLLS